MCHVCRAKAVAHKEKAIALAATLKAVLEPHMAEIRALASDAININFEVINTSDFTNADVDAENHKRITAMTNALHKSLKNVTGLEFLMGVMLVNDFEEPSPLHDLGVEGLKMFESMAERGLSTGIGLGLDIMLDKEEQKEKMAAATHTAEGAPLH